jgi:hypothetical protein
MNVLVPNKSTGGGKFTLQACEDTATNHHLGDRKQPLPDTKSVGALILLSQAAEL